MSNNLKILEVLGNQGKRKFGNVFLASDANTLEKYVLKSAKKEVQSARAIDLFRNESQFSFSHECLPQVLLVEENGETINLLLRYKTGIDLQSFWDQLPKNERLPFCKQLVKKMGKLLDEIHQQSIYHCDIKPSNILIDGTSTSFDVKLIDFGMAINSTADNSSRKLLFPLGFAAPELILNKIDCVQASTDYFAFGVTIYKLWTGELPLAHPNPSIFTNLQLAHPIPDHPELSSSLNQWIQQMCIKPHWRTAPNLMTSEEVQATLEKSFAERFQSTSAFITAFDAIKEKRFWLW